MANFVTYSDANTLFTKVGNKIKALGGAYITKGSTTFANLPASVTEAMNGYVYNITNDFETDVRFVEGAGKKYSAGTNVVAVDLSTYAYNAVTPVGSENPSTEGWYEQSGADYTLTSDTTVQSGKTYYERTKTANHKYDVLGNFINVDEINGRINATQGMIVPAFDSATAYEVGDVVTYEDGLYIFTTAHAAGDWDASDVTTTTVKALIEAAEPDGLTTAQLNTLLGLLD